MESRKVWPVIIIGAGAAGAMAGIFAARAGVKTLILDGRRHPGAKIRVSGGGRCNILPQSVSATDYDTSGSRNIVRNLLRSWPIPEVRAFFETTLRLPLVDEAPHKVFPKSGRSKDVVEALYGELERAGAVLKTAWRVASIKKCASSGTFLVTSEAGEVIECSRLILATGGLSMPTTGSDGSGFRLAKQCGHRLLQTRPALVALVGQSLEFRALAGLSTPALVTIAVHGKKTREWAGPLLFTHRGLSGPVALNASLDFDSAASEAFSMTCAWGDFESEEKARAQWGIWLDEARNRSISHVLRDHLPRRLADTLCELARVPNQGLIRANILARDDRQRLLTLLTACPMEIDATEGYKTAEITQGGISLDSIRSRTLESRTFEGLYFAGEILDVTGKLGGFNFQWAWVTGRRAGESAAKACLAGLAPERTAA